MAYTVPGSFIKFSDNISLSGDHKETADARRERLISLLSNSFSILESFATGSIPRGTALKSKADLDIMVALHWSKHIKDRSPEQVLQSVRDALGKYRTNVRKNGQAVTLHYDSWPNVDIVPVSISYNSDNSVNHYNVPDMTDNTWLESRPKTHSTNVNGIASYKPIIRMIKQWNSEHSDLMESYHIEVLALKIFTLPFDTYTWAVYRFFDEAVKLTATPLWHDSSFADEYITSSAARQEILKRLITARDKSLRAWNLTYGSNSDDRGAIEIWRQIFGAQFPAYG